MTALLRRLFARRLPRPVPAARPRAITELELLRALGCDE